MLFNYEEKVRDGRARRGVIDTRRGKIDTPVFMPVGTKGTVKALLPEELKKIGGEILLGNTYHLMLRPGLDIIELHGDLHDFMKWNGPILTDSGGFQVFSLGSLCEVKEEGVLFRNHINGDLMRLTPESVIKAQEKLGSDIMMMLDECPSSGLGKSYLESSLERDFRWACRAKVARTTEGGALIGIIQGGTYVDLRKKSVELICSQEFEGYALGGLSVGEPKELMFEVIERTVSLLPKKKPIYLMGVGLPEDLVMCVGLGVDMFDCVLPTRMARNGVLFTKNGRLNIRNARYSKDVLPIDEDCDCIVCKTYSRAYLRHLFINRELLVYRLNTIHNLYYVLNLMKNIRSAISGGNYESFVRSFFNELEL